MNILNKILIRFLGRAFIKVNSPQVNNSINQVHLIKQPDSILQNENFFDFRTTPIKNKKYVSIGSKCLIKATFTFETESGNVSIGDNVHIGGAHIICKSSVDIGNDVTMAWGIIIYDHNSHSINWEERKNDNYQCYEDYINFNGDNIKNKDWSNVVSKPIKISSKVWIGFDVLILKGVTIGEGAVVGARSVVTKDVEPWTVVAGNPARIVKRLN